MRTLTRPELTATLAARQLLVKRRRMSVPDAVAYLTPLQAQHPTAPFIALAARLDRFTRAGLERALAERAVVKTTINRRTLHLVAAGDYPAYAQLVRRPWLRTWRKEFAHLDEERVVAELREFLREPRTNTEIREHMCRHDGIDADEPWTSVLYARLLLPLVQLPPAGSWNDPQRSRFLVHPGPLPSAGDAAELVVRRYLAAFGPASRRDIASWGGVPQRDFAEGLERIETVTYRDEAGSELLDLPGARIAPASTPLPVRFLGRWEQVLLAYAQRDRIIPPEVQPLKLTLSGDQTVTVDGRVAASWLLERQGRRARVTIAPHVEVARAARAEIREAGERTARFCAPDAEAVEVTGA